MGVIEAGNRAKTQPDFLVNIILLIGRTVRRNLPPSLGLSRGKSGCPYKGDANLSWGASPAGAVGEPAGLVGVRCGISLEASGLAARRAQRGIGIHPPDIFAPG